ncbi:MAG: hypothetical protein K9J37_19890 [Saprospiraceae bacterium]|nr:hypothetical protein [Saprospiraceae bacterium]MCF8252189.1 hypothetical protein [Saprospiraceae bacterium]MCF8281558.1 hypothetical protein [Bacteroidales bacterium]MCF8313858.1 hypothetical protein [Saprospiraceae bacterium]MCF8442550.1 hypothetical protein [Saprospiraceae bacterium]
MNRKTFLPFFRADTKSERLNIPVTQKSRQLLNDAKSAIENAEPQLALDNLYQLDSPTLKTALLGLRSRLSEYTKNKHQGVLTSEHESVGYNRLSRDIIELISKLEKELESDKNNYGEIRNYLIEKRYKPRIHQKLAGDQLFNLNVQYSSEGTSKEKAETYLTLQGEESGEKIKKIFQTAGGRLLVTGLPGAGKTSLLLHLVIELLEAEKDSLAVLLNLATWRSDFITLDDWLKEILPAELGVTKRYAAEILQKGQLTLLFDGLDEVDEAHRASCLKAIGEYGRLVRDYVISTRKDEYKVLEKDAPVWAQIEVLPLTDKQLLAQLDHADRRDFPEAPDLKAALQNDPLLLQVAETPFYLNCLQLLFRGGSTLSELKFKGETLEARQAEIIERFTEQALAMQSKQGFAPEQVRHWLAFIASRMTQRNKVVFELVDLQYDWWKWGKFQLLSVNILDVIIKPFAGILYMSLLLGMLKLLERNINNALEYAGMTFLTLLLIVIIIAIIWTIIGKHKLAIIESKDNYQFSNKILFKLFKKNLTYSLIFGIVIYFVSKSLFTTFIWVSIITFLGIMTDFLQKHSLSLLQITTPYQRFTASAKALHFSILQHWLLRWQLYRVGVLPLRLVHFLNEMTARHLLETDGATWRFRHRILQEYFAEQWKENESEKP